MLAHYTWNQFFWTAAAVLSAYYLVLLPGYYRAEVKSLMALCLKRLRRGATAQASPPAPLMGPVAGEPAPLLTDSRELRVAPPATSGAAPVPGNPAAAVAAQLASLLALARETKADKAELTALLQLLFARHQPLAPHDQQLLSQQVLDQCRGTFPFELALADVQPLWADTLTGRASFSQVKP